MTLTKNKTDYCVLEFNEKQQILNFNTNTTTSVKNTFGWVAIADNISIDRAMSFQCFLRKGGYTNKKRTIESVKNDYKTFVQFLNILLEEGLLIISKHKYKLTYDDLI